MFSSSSGLDDKEGKKVKIGGQYFIFPNILSNLRKRATEITLHCHCADEQI